MNITELKVEMLRNGDTVDDLAKALNITRVTLYNKMNRNKTDFTLGEMYIIMDRYHLSAERMMQIFFASGVSEQDTCAG
jgi:hypothetical protein